MTTARWVSSLAVIFAFMAPGAAGTQERLADGVVFHLPKGNETDPRWLKIQICTPAIIRVIASQEQPFSTRPSLIAATTAWDPVPWSTAEKGEWTEISTSRLTLRVNRNSGAVAFLDDTGHLLLSERQPGGKSEQTKILTRAEVMGEKTWHIQQLFDSPDDEAFFGLGQHQNGIMNYKGYDVDLWQVNIVAVVPFLVSSRNYGILWDNCSRTKFGDMRDYAPLSSMILRDDLGRRGGLTVRYFNDRQGDSLLTTRRETDIAHDFVDQPGVYPLGFDVRRGSVRWTGSISSNTTGFHKFRLYSSGYTKMWLDGQLVVNSWRQNWLPWTHMLRLPMERGKRYQVRIEWIPDGGSIGLKCLTPEDPKYARSLSLYSDVADQIDYYFVHGRSLDEIIQGYRAITGQAPMMPKWAMGFWQSRERYTSQDELLSVVREFRRRGIPLDNIVQDWFYWKEDQWGSHEFDPARFPDPARMVQLLHDSLSTHIMISVWPKFYVGTEHYREFEKQGWLYMHNVQKGVRDWVGPGYVSTFMDPFSAGARDLFWKHVNENLFSKGFDAWWLDSTEPDMESNVSVTERLLRMHPNALGSAARNENAYSLMMAKGVFENQRKTKPDQRVFILTRSAYAGQQRYAAATWSGDVASRWEDLKAQIPAGLNFCLSGIPYWSTDIGGFAPESRYEHPDSTALDEWRELNTRWFQFSAFCPLFRSHGQFPLREMFNMAPMDHPAYQTMLAYDRLRYRLMPYIYSLTGMVTRDGYTIMRALAMDFPHDRKVYGVADQYMFGPALLVNPVTEYRTRSRPVYLPVASAWYDLRTGRRYEGGSTIMADAPYTHMPLFARAGSIIPCGPAIQHTDQKADPIRVFVFGGARGSFTLYEDEGVNYDYEKGMFSLIPFEYDDSAHTLHVGARLGSFPSMLGKRTFEVVLISPAREGGLDFERAPDATVTYEGSALSIPIGQK